MFCNYGIGIIGMFFVNTIIHSNNPIRMRHLICVSAVAADDGGGDTGLSDSYRKDSDVSFVSFL